MLITAKSKHFCDKIEECGRDSKLMFRTMYGLLGRGNISHMPNEKYNAGARACVPRYASRLCSCNYTGYLWVNVLNTRYWYWHSRLSRGKLLAIICDMIQERLPQRATRSSTSVMLTQPYSNTKTFGDCAFSIVAPRLWNELQTAMREPLSLDNFKQKLKTCLFRKAFSRFLWSIM